MTTINKTDGSILVTVADGTIDTSASDLTLVGKQYLNYGEPIIENFVKLLENFAKASAPANPLVGQIWYDSANKKLKVYRSTGFVDVGTIISSNTQPSNSAIGDCWWDTVNSIFKVYTGSTWIGIGQDENVPQSAVTQHQAALSITKSQISDFGTYVPKSSAPVTSVGLPGDVAGLLAPDLNYLYYCTAPYDGITHIWKRVAWSTDTW